MGGRFQQMEGIWEHSCGSVQPEMGWKLGLAAVGMTGVLGARSVWGAHPVSPQTTPLALPWYQEFNTFDPLQGPRFNICCFCPQCCFCPHCNPFFSCCPISALYIQQCWSGRREWQQTEQRVGDHGRSWRWRPQQCCIHPV